MNLSDSGNPTLTCEVTGVTQKGLWLLVSDKEYFLSFEIFPMLAKIPVDKIFAIDFFPPEHLRWEEYDVDIELSSIVNPAGYPNLFS